MAKWYNNLYMFHIVFLSPHSDPEARLGEVDSGGQCVYEFQLAKNLSMIEGVQVTIYCRKKFDYPYISHVNERFLVKRIVCGGDEFIPKEELAPLIDEFAQKVSEDLKRTPPQIVCGHYWDGGSAALHLYKYIPDEFPMVWTPHSLGVDKRKRFAGVDNEMIYKFIPRLMWESYTMLLSDMVIVSTQDEMEHVVRDYQIEPNKIQIIPIGIETDVLQPADKKEARAHFDLPQDKTIIVSFGRLDKRKGYHNCIQVFAEFKKNTSADALLVIFSGKHKNLTSDETLYQQELERLAKQLGVEDSVLYKDAVPHEEIRYVLSASDAYLCLSETEPFGISVLEAMYAQIPVIATINGGPRNIITMNTNGILVDPHDFERAAFDLASVIKDKKFRKKLIANARKHVEQNYTWGARAQEFYQAYLDLAKHPSAHAKRDFLRHIGVIS
ncbi:MAG: glycosyltransferase [bacterium]|nr:glycosyltransferase [bacterium]